MSDPYLEAAFAVYEDWRNNRGSVADLTSSEMIGAVVEAWVGDRESLYRIGDDWTEKNPTIALWIETGVLVRVSVTEGEQHPFNDVLSPPSGICADCGKRENQHE